MWLWNLIQPVLTSSWTMSVAFFASIFTNLQAYIWLAVVIIGMIFGFQIGGWWYKTDCTSKAKAAYNVGYDSGFFRGYDAGKSGERKPLIPHLWAPGLVSTNVNGTINTDDPEVMKKVEIYHNHVLNCPDCQKPGELCHEGLKLLEDIGLEDPTVEPAD